MKETGERADKTQNLKVGPKSNDATSGKTLPELGITRDQSSKWQQPSLGGKSSSGRGRRIDLRPQRVVLSPGPFGNPKRREPSTKP